MSVRADFQGDYMGFSFGKKEDGTPMHSSELGIVRVSDGSRFNENLLPTMQNKTVQVPGGDGTYYFGSYYTQRQFNVSFAFDGLTEEQIAKIKRVFGDKGIHDLIFDEAPYKIYSAKVTGTATIKYIPFAEGSTNRLYKGEGSIQFTCYQPFARCSCDKSLSDFSNTGEWASASRLPTANELKDYNTYDPSTGKISLYNAGDIETHFTLRLYFRDFVKQDPEDASKTIALNAIPAGSITLNGFALEWDSMSKQDEDTYIIIDSKQNLIKGAKGTEETGNIYNQYITDGSFFTIPVGSSVLQLSQGCRPNNADSKRADIKYNYLYI